MSTLSRVGLIGLGCLVALGLAACGSEEDGEGELMAPGKACLACHGPAAGNHEAAEHALGFAGTIYESRAGEQPAEGVLVVVEDVTGQLFEVGSNRVGNFFVERPVPTPMMVEVRDGDRVLRMESPAPSGDCNACHSAAGGAGRLTRP